MCRNLIISRHNSLIRIGKFVFFTILCFAIIPPGFGFKCVLNPYYVPICGSDNKTYGNKDLLNCVNKGRPPQRQIRAMMHRECKPLICPSFESLEGFWPSKHQRPVCANNGNTYGDIHQIRCLKDYYPSIEVAHEGGCTVQETRRALGTNAKRKSCLNNRIKFEQNPVCLSNNITYSNSYKAICESSGLREKIGGVCDCPFQRHCQRAREITMSMKTAPPRERVRLTVCGSDYRNYRSEEHLNCARRYNRYLYLLYRGTCRKLKFIDACPKKLKYEKSVLPVCGSDKKSYTSIHALNCARSRINKSLKFLHDGPCVKPT